MSLVTVQEVRDALEIGALYDDEVIQSCIDSAEILILNMLRFDDGGYEGVAPVAQAILMTSCDIWQARSATNGQAVAVDFTPAPFRMGKSLLSRVSGLLAPYISLGTLVG